MKKVLGTLTALVMVGTTAHAQRSSDETYVTGDAQVRGSSPTYSRNMDRYDADSRSLREREQMARGDRATFGALGEHGRVNAGNDEIGRSRSYESATAWQREGWSEDPSEVVASIRSEVVRDTTLSDPARNVAVIASSDDTVILRGEVNTQAERSRLLRIASRHAGEVIDELTVNQG